MLTLTITATIATLALIVSLISLATAINTGRKIDAAINQIDRDARDARLEDYDRF